MSFGRYKLLDKTSEGHLSESFVAQPLDDSGQTNQVLVVRILPSLLEDERLVSLFQQESRVTAKMEHRNLVKVIEFGDVEGWPYCVTENVGGLSCARFLTRCTNSGIELSVSESVFIVSEVLHALAYIHQTTDETKTPLGLIHGEVGIERVFIEKDGNVKLDSFGVGSQQQHNLRASIAKSSDQSFRLAPEQILGLAFDQRVDLFNAGVMLAELHIRQPLFSAGNQLTTLLAIRDVQLDALNECSRPLPPKLLERLDTALSQNPDKRYQSADEMNEALQSFFGVLTRDELRDEISQLVNDTQSSIPFSPPAQSHTQVQSSTPTWYPTAKQPLSGSDSQDKNTLSESEPISVPRQESLDSLDADFDLDVSHLLGPSDEFDSDWKIWNVSSTVGPAHDAVTPGPFKRETPPEPARDAVTPGPFKWERERRNSLDSSSAPATSSTKEKTSRTSSADSQRPSARPMRQASTPPPGQHPSKPNAHRPSSSRESSVPRRKGPIDPLSSHGSYRHSSVPPTRHSSVSAKRRRDFDSKYPQKEKDSRDPLYSSEGYLVEMARDDAFWNEKDRLQPSPNLNKSDTNAQTPLIAAVIFRRADGSHLGPFNFSDALDRVYQGEFLETDEVSINKGPFRKIADALEFSRGETQGELVDDGHPQARTTPPANDDGFDIPLDSLELTTESFEFDALDDVFLPGGMGLEVEGALREPQKTGKQPHRKGWLNVEPVCRIIYEVARDEKSCSIIFEHGPMRKYVDFVKGKAAYVKSNMASEAFTEYLTRNNILSQMELEMALAMRGKFDDDLSSALVGLGLLDREALEHQLSQRVKASLLDLMQWSKGEYKIFELIEKKEHLSHGVDVFVLLWESIQSRFQKSVLDDWIESYRNALVQPQESMECLLEKMELPTPARQLLSSLKGSRTVENLIERYSGSSHQQQYQAVRVLILLEELALVDIKAPER